MSSSVNVAVMEFAFVNKRFTVSKRHFNLFPKLTKFMKGRKFVDDEHKWLAGGPRSRILRQWNSGYGKTLTKCISVGGDYVEK